MTERKRQKTDVARAFSKAAPTYNRTATFQKDVGTTLLVFGRSLSMHPARWLDLGCGTGQMVDEVDIAFPGAVGIGLDVALGMVRQMRANHPNQPGFVGDMEAVPTGNDTFDLVFSNLAVQWSENLPRLMTEVSRILRPGGVFLFSTLTTGSLHEIAESWATVDSAVHVNTFRVRDDYARSAADVGLTGVLTVQEPRVLFFENARAAMHSVKGIGAGNANAGRARGLTSRSRFQTMERAYERLRSKDGLPLTYQLLYAAFRKPA